ncbi:MAG: glycosyltransferase family 2 protein [Candidatus Omnitrophica bacterium]|nr:glycosyltransferase family 2 protein [Candidatus Omnitrophota bacterium]
MAISLVMPVYNEEGVIEKVVRDCYAEIIAKIEGSEFIIVNDASTDSTPEILERLAKEFPQIKLLRLDKNNGHGNALRAGFAKVRNPVILHMDSDAQFQAGQFWKLYQRLADSDIVLGLRASRHDPLHRKAISFIVRLINMALFGFLVKDINSPFKCIKTGILQDILNDIPPNAFAISILMVIMAKHKGYRVAEVPIIHFPRTTGRSKLASARYLFKKCLFCLLDILRVKWNLLTKNRNSTVGRNENYINNP